MGSGFGLLLDQHVHCGGGGRGGSEVSVDGTGAVEDEVVLLVVVRLLF